MLITALIAGSISHIRTSRELVRVKSELTNLRNELAELDVSNDDRIYAIALPTYGHMQWRWRIQLPASGSFRLRYAFSQIPESDFPATSKTLDQVFLDSYAKPVPGGESFILSIAIFKDGKDRWSLQTNVPGRGGTRPIENPPKWLDDSSFVHWSTNVYGKNKTVSAKDTEELVLLKYRKGKTVPGGVTVDMQPTEGMMFWVECIEGR